MQVLCFIAIPFKTYFNIDDFHRTLEDQYNYQLLTQQSLDLRNVHRKIAVALYKHQGEIFRYCYMKGQYDHLVDDEDLAGIIWTSGFKEERQNVCANVETSL